MGILIRGMNCGVAKVGISEWLKTWTARNVKLNCCGLTEGTGIVVRNAIGIGQYREFSVVVRVSSWLPRKHSSLTACSLLFSCVALTSNHI